MKSNKTWYLSYEHHTISNKQRDESYHLLGVFDADHVLEVAEVNGMTVIVESSGVLKEIEINQDILRRN